MTPQYTMLIAEDAEVLCSRIVVRHSESWRLSFSSEAARVSREAVAQHICICTVACKI